MNHMSLKKAYLYLVSVISLVIAVIGAIMLINLALKAWVFTKADQNYVYPVAGCPQPSNPGTSDAYPCTTPPDQLAQEMQQQKDQQSSQRQTTAAQAIAMILVATPVWMYHWRLARKEV